MGIVIVRVEMERVIPFKKADALSGKDRAALMELSDQEVLSRVQDGDQELFEVIVSRYKNKIVNLIFYMINDYEKALELAQDTFIKVFSKSSSYNRNLPFHSWIYKIGSNIAIDELRRRKRKPLYLLDDDKGYREETNPALNSRFDLPEDQLLQSEMKKKVREAVQTLPQKYRLPLILKDIEGHSYEEVASMVGRPSGTIKSRVNRARLILREKLCNYFNGSEAF